MSSLFISWAFSKYGSDSLNLLSAFSFATVYFLLSLIWLAISVNSTAWLKYNTPRLYCASKNSLSNSIAFL